MGQGRRHRRAPRPTGPDAACSRTFWFDDDAQWAPIGLLSGGERRRLQLLLVLSEHPNVLLLDRPTNDLDSTPPSGDFLDEWPGALVVVSHDRAFLERTVADVIVLDGRVTSAAARAGARPTRRARAVRSRRRTASVAGPDRTGSG